MVCSTPATKFVFKTKMSAKVQKNLRKKSKKVSKAQVEKEFGALQSIVPSISAKTGPDSSLTKLDIVLEAIQYIQRLEKQLCETDPNLLRDAYLATLTATKL